MAFEVHGFASGKLANGHVGDKYGARLGYVGGVERPRPCREPLTVAQNLRRDGRPRCDRPAISRRTTWELLLRQRFCAVNGGRYFSTGAISAVLAFCPVGYRPAAGKVE